MDLPSPVRSFSSTRTMLGRLRSSRRAVVVLLLAGLVAALPPLQYNTQDSGGPDSVAMVDDGWFEVWAAAAPDSGVGTITFGDVGDVPLMGDWDCDGVDSPGVFRVSTGRVYLRDVLASGSADREFSLGARGDVPLVGDFDGDGCDTVSIFRPSAARVYLSNSLDGKVASEFYFGNLGDTPFVGDFNGDGVDTVGLHRVSTGHVYFRNTNDAGFADFEFMFGDPGDQVIAGDWDGNGTDTVAAYRRSNGVLYLKNTHVTGVADRSITVGSHSHALTASGISASIVADIAPRPVEPAPGMKVYEPDVHVYQGDNLAQLASSNPAGTVFMVHGLHVNQSVNPKNGQVFVSAGDAVLDGRNQTEHAFSGSASNVVIQGFEIKNYDTPPQIGSIHTRGDGWIIEANNVHHSAGGGISITDADRGVIRNNRIHHNHQLGIKVRRSNNTIVEGNEIAYNNWLKEYEWGWEAGGTKFWDTENLIVRNNHSHHNWGPGLWDDHDNNNILYEGNLVENNAGPGIFREIGYSGIVRNNTAIGNGFSANRWLWGAGILIAATQDTEVYGNVVKGNANGITMIQQNRGSGDRGTWLVKNNYVHDNTISGGKSGAVRDNGSDAIFTSNNRYHNNTYTGDHQWAWDGKTNLTWTAWRATGNDQSGTYR